MVRGITETYLYLFSGPRLLRLRLLRLWLILRVFLLGLGMRLFFKGFRLFLQWSVADDVLQNIGQRDDPEQTSFPSAALFILFSLNDDEPMHSALVYQLEKCPEGI